MKVIASIYSGQAPIKSGLMLVMTRAVLRQNSFPIGGKHRMDVGPEIFLCILDQQWLHFSLSEN